MKKYAFITVTKNGALLAQKLRQAFDAGDIYAKCGRYDAKALQNSLDNVQEFKVMRDLIEAVFYKYEALIFFTSTGIAVRMIAPYLVHKAKDPAVVVLDEQAHFAISLLSGHLGGANELTQKIADILNAVPVITTATDANKMMAPDVVAAKLQLVPYPLEHIKIVNAALVQQQQMAYYIDETWQKADYYCEKLHQLGFNAVKINEQDLSHIAVPCVFISPKRQILRDILILTPRRLIVGLGCRKDTPVALIDTAIKKALYLAKCNDLSIGKLVSTVVKSHEQGILQWAQEHEIVPQFFENEIMSKMIAKYHITESPFVKKQIGIGNVCEAAILSYNEKAKIILPKTKFEKVTVSLAWE